MSSQLEVAADAANPRVDRGVNELVGALRADGHRVARVPLDGNGDADVVVAAGDDAAERGLPAEMDSEGFAVRTDDGLAVLGSDDVGAMYGAMDAAERVRAGGLDAVSPRAVTPTVPFRAVKFNLPWSPYRDGEQTARHLDTCRDLGFWERFLDHLAANRFNALTLWNLHPFPYMVRTERFPEACPFDDAELADWQSFWHDLFRMADERGIETYVLNWNIVVSPEFAEAHGVDERNDTSDVVREYTRESVRATVEEYPNLTGLGVSLCDWMEGLTPAEKQDWLLDTVVAGVEDADREVTFLDRSVLTESMDELRRGLDEVAAADNVSDVLVPTKFNWSHGHSTSRLEMTHDYSSGEVDDRLWSPEPENYRVAWTVRNEDFFVLRWGDPEFVREHVRENALDVPHVGGYVVGSEGFVPAVDYSHDDHRHRTWQYAFEKQWLFYAVWGRLLYDHETGDETFERLFEARYRDGVGETLREAYCHAGLVPETIASVVAGTWDYTLYSEGFMQLFPAMGPHDGVSPFVSVDELIEHEPLDATVLSVPEYVAGEGDGASPLELADRVGAAAERTLELAGEVPLGTYPGALECEVQDLRAWGHLGQYVADKLRGAVALHRFRTGGEESARAAAVDRLEDAADHWDDLAAVTEGHYRPVPYARERGGPEFSWANFRDQVRRDVELARSATRS